MLKFLTQSDTREYALAYSLWNECFPEDAGGFSGYYFEFRTRPEYILCDFDDNTKVLRGALHIIPQAIKTNNQILSVAFIAGVATTERFRGRGIASNLMRHAEKFIGDSGCAGVLLQPASLELFDFYERLGYSSLCSYYTAELEVGRSKKSHDAFKEEDAGVLLRIYNKYAECFDSHIVRNRERFALLITEYSRCGGMVVCDGRGYITGYPDERNVCVVYEAAGCITEGLVHKLAMLCNCSHIRLMASKQVFEMININLPELRETPFNAAKWFGKAPNLGEMLTLERY